MSMDAFLKLSGLVLLAVVAIIFSIQSIESAIRLRNWAAALIFVVTVAMSSFLLAQTISGMSVLPIQ